MTNPNQGLSHHALPSKPQGEISRILTAAVVNARFRQLLLTNPDDAIAMGYGGEVFHLGKEERNSLAAIQATNLADFATQLAHIGDVANASPGYTAGD